MTFTWNKIFHFLINRVLLRVIIRVMPRVKLKNLNSTYNSNMVRINSMIKILNLRPKNKMIRRVEIESAKRFVKKYVKFAVSIIYENDIITVRLWGRGGFSSTFNYSIHDYAKNAILARGLNELINRGELIDQHVIYTHDDNGNLWFYVFQLMRFRLYGVTLYATRVIENEFNGKLIYGKALFFVDIFKTPYGYSVNEINEKINEFFSRLNA